MELEVGEVVICTVERIQGTIVFVNIEGNGEGSIVLSEIAPGRIRNLRDYVVPKKVIACKILKISGDRIELSLRRVTQKEVKEVKEQHKLEKSYKNIIKTVSGENAEKIIKEICEKENLCNFLEKSKENSKELEEYLGKEKTKKIIEILNSQKAKKAIIKKEIKLTTKEENGLKIIKELLNKIKDAEIKYISAGRYSLKIESSDPKKADQKIKEILEELEKTCKSKSCDFSFK